MSGTGTLIKYNLKSCIQYNRVVPTLVPAIYSFSQTSNSQGNLTKVFINGYNIMPYSYVKFGSYKFTNIIYNSSTNIGFYVPNDVPSGTYSVQVITSALYSNSIQYMVI